MGKESLLQTIRSKILQALCIGGVMLVHPEAGAVGNGWERRSGGGFLGFGAGRQDSWLSFWHRLGRTIR